MQDSQSLSLYKIDGCPYCHRVATAIDDLELEIEERNIHKTPKYASELEAAVGRTTVPVLRTDSGGSTEWLPESADIVNHLYAVYGNGRKPSLFASPAIPLLGKVAAVGLFAAGVLSSGATQIGFFIAAVVAWVLGIYAPMLRKWF